MEAGRRGLADKSRKKEDESKKRKKQEAKR